jgi:hypothetical protein
MDLTLCLTNRNKVLLISIPVYDMLRFGRRGVEQLVARRAHNPKVVGSSPSPATKYYVEASVYQRFFIFWLLTLTRTTYSYLNLTFLYLFTFI